MLKVYNRSLEIINGKGVYLFDNNQKRYLDFTSGIAVCSLGHGDTEIAKVLFDQAGKLSHVSNLFLNEPAKKLAKVLKVESKMDSCFFSNSGTEANEAALKFARKHGHSIHRKKTNIVAFAGGFHGRTFGSLSATMTPKYKKHFKPTVPGFQCFQYNNTDIIDFGIDENTCAVIIEPIQGEGGVTPATSDFLKKIRQACTQHNAILIFDEIQCGLARTGKLFCKQHYDIQPDILTIAKPLG
eukprot:NODE_13_length_54415_cov_0.522424.p30 type:complete len:241 gc:universal NODE_13_length_54415_cov_0.522424:49386-50108(+)